MKNITKLKIEKPANEIFEAIVDPIKIGNFWFSSSLERWEQGKTITIRYDEYNAEGQIEILEIEINKKIVFHDFDNHMSQSHLKNKAHQARLSKSLKMVSMKVILN